MIGLYDLSSGLSGRIAAAAALSAVGLNSTINCVCDPQMIVLSYFLFVHFMFVKSSVTQS